MRKTRAPPRFAPGAPSSSFPIVGIGASAGGYEAFSQLLAALPTDTGMAFVLIQHLDPTHPSMLTSMLAKATTMPVLEIEHDMRPAPDHVYVMPSGADVGLSGDTFTLLPRDKASKPHLPIDSFFQTLAEQRAEQGIGVILSGTGSDGTAGLQAIKAEGGVTIVQDPGSAKFGGMPESALAAGIVDLSLGIPEVAAELARLAHHAYLRRRDVDVVAESDAADLERVFALVRTGIGVDLSEYKEPSIRRRLGRRMALKRIETLADYATFVREHPGEDRALFADILIHVTSFFRDAETFETLKTSVFPEIIKLKQPDDPIRIWVTGCSTGQEVYSVAIVLLEFLGDQYHGRRVQVFGSDISDTAIETARAGVYPDSIASDVNPERLRRFFSKVEGGYAISKAVREVCVFVRHDLARDPAFSRLDLITCRNVLIYFDQELQRRVLGTFHYSLNIPGMLLLGRAENTLEDLFSPVDATHKIFARNSATSSLRFAGVRGPLGRRRDGPGSAVRDRDAPEVDVTRQVDTQLLAQYAPPGVLINERMEVIQFRGQTGPYLEAPAGQPQLNVLKMARPELLSDLRIALARAIRDSVAVRREGIVVKRDGVARTCAVVVAPVTGVPGTERLFTVLFEDTPSAARGRRKPGPRGAKGRVSPERVAMLEEDLAATKDYLESLIVDHQKTNDALASANEELASGNEELQSVNEELETAKEELQSSNEELTTLNDELHDRNQELGQLNSDLGNVINSVEIPLVMLDAERHIRWVTPGARTVMNILPSDIGRSIELIRPKIAIEKIHELVTAVMQSGAMSEIEVEDRDGRWYRLQVRPYKALDGKTDGTVISIIDIDLLRRAVAEAEWARDYAAGVVEAIGTPLVVLDAALAVLSANHAFYEFFSRTAESVVGRPLQLGQPEHGAPDLHQALGDIVNSRDHLGKILVPTTVPSLGERKLLLIARPVRSPNRRNMMLLSLEDVTDRLVQEASQASMLRSAQAAEVRAEDANAAKDRFLAVVSHELRTPLSSLLLHVELLRRMEHGDPAVARVTEGIERASKTQARLIDDLLDVSRISNGKLELDRKILRLPEVIHDAVDLVRPMANQKFINLQVALTDALPPLLGDAARLRQVFWNLLANAIKFTPDKGVVTVTADVSEGLARVAVRDTGIGIEPKFRRLLFQPFAQMHDGNARVHGGLGLGLAIVREVVELHGGNVRAESAGAGQGATFTVHLPVIKHREEVTDDAAAPAAAPRNEEPALRPERVLEGLRVLLAEDDDGTREPLVAMLAHRGAEVRGVSSAAEAMKVFLEFKPQVVVSDVGMPGEDGYSFVRRIRQLSQEEGGHTPALALTAFARAEDRRKAIEAGFDVHAAKPIEFERLANTLLELSRVGAERREKQQWSSR